MKPTWSRTFVVCALIFDLCASMGWADLRSYVQRPDSSYAFKLDSTHDLGPVVAYNIRLTSQTWEGIVWHHWLTVLRPKDLQFTDKAMLFITGGSNGGPAPTFNNGRNRLMVQMAVRSKAVVAVLHQVPNEPLFNGRREDQIIAYTFDKFLSGQGEDWPLLLPMVKSAVRAMDAVQQFARTQFRQDITGFLVTGASKRGWTTWLTGAVDSRAIAIAPMVIDMLDMPVQMKRQIMSYGKYSSEIEDYTRLHIQERMNTPQGKKLTAIVDPFSYLESLTMPKLILLGTNDPYWTVDAANVYLKSLKGKTYLHYEPNAGHGLGPGAFPALLAFYQATLRNQGLPQVSATTLPSGAVQATYDDSPKLALWLARSVTRDFRHAKWVKHPLSASTVISDAGFSEMGYAAYFVAFTFTNKEDVTYSLSSAISVRPPNTFPYTAQGVKVVRSEPRGENQPLAHIPKSQAAAAKPKH